MKAAPFLIILLPAVALATGTATDQITMKPQASPSCTSGRACIYGKSGTNRVYIVDSAGLELQSNAARSFRTSADCSALSSPANGDVCYDTTLTAFRLYSAGWTSAPANDSLLVHKANSETITGAKTFSAAPVFAAGLTASGASANDFSGGSGTFKTSTGAVTIGPGAVTFSGAPLYASVASTASGTSSFDYSSASGIFKTSTGAVTIGPGAVAINGATTHSAAVLFSSAATTASGTSSFDLSGGSGVFKTPTGAVTIGTGAINLTGAVALAGYPHSFLAHADTAAATVYLGGADRGAAAATQVALFVAPAAGTVRGMACTMGTAPGGIVSDVFTLQKSSDQGSTWSDTASTITITGAGMTGSDTTHFPTVAQYDLLAVKIVKDGASVSAAYNCQVTVQ